MTTNKKNLYICHTCRGMIVTIDRDEGVTPMLLNCKVRDHCHGRMVSMMYPDEPWPEKSPGGEEIPTEPTWEWYKPDHRERARMRKKARQRGGVYVENAWHVDNGGLMLRKIEEPT